MRHRLPRAAHAIGALTLASVLACTGCAPARPVAATNAPQAQPPAAHAHHGQGFQHRFDGAEDWAKVFDAADRDAWQQPEQVLDAMSLDARSRVADVGAGTGYFAVRVARRLGPEGGVFAIDLEPDMVRYLGARAAREGLTNLTPVLAGANDPRIPEPVDVVLIVDTLHHIGEREAYLAKLAARLRPGGRLVVVDFAPDATMGPPKAHRLSADEVVDTAARAGFSRTRALSLPQQYVLVFTRTR